MLDPHEALHQHLRGRYELEDVIGEGGMGTVYLARDRRHDRPVAIKTVRPDLTTDAIRRRFEREIRITARLQHPHILPLLDSGVAGETVYYVMPYLEGESLESRLKRDGKLSPDEVVRIGLDVAEGLECAHERGVIHRDIKPGNILLTGRHAMILDFGIAKALAETDGDTLTQTGWSPGSPHYMAPEQFEGGTTAKSDLYALGLVLYEALTGHKRSAGFEPEPDWGEVPPGLRTVIEKALVLDPGERWPDAGAFRGALAAQRRGGARRIPTHRRIVVGALATVGTVGLLLAALGQIRRAPEPGPRAVVSQRQVTFAGNVLEAAISPEGDFLAYTTQGSDGMRLMVEDLESRSSIQIAATSDLLYSPDWSPDGRQILVTSTDITRGGTWVYPRLGGDPYSVPTAGITRWSADGRQLYSWYENSHHVVFYTLASAEWTRILTPDTTAWFIDAAEHPMGEGLALLQAERGGGEHRIWWVKIAPARRFEGIEPGAAARPADEYDLLVEDAATLLSLEWSPEGDALYYLREDESAYQVWRLPTEVDGTARGTPELLVSGVELAASTTEALQSILSSPREGSQLFVVRGRASSNLWSMRARGEAWQFEPLTQGTAINRAASASPDGEWLAYNSSVAGRTNVYLMPSRGGASRQLTRVDSVSGDPAWSPDGGSLAFGIRRMDGDAIAVVSVGEPTRIRVFESTNLSSNGTLDWAPGAEILYQRPGIRNFHFLDPDTAEERPLLSADSARLGWPLKVRYAPDGNQFAMAWNRNPRRDETGLYLFSLAGGTHRRLIPQLALPMGWSADGRTVYALWRDRREVLSVPIDGGAPTVLETLPFEPSFVGTTHAGEWFVFDSPEVTGDVWRLEDFDPES